MTGDASGLRIGVDLGGTKIEGILLAGDGTILQRKRVATPAEHYERVLSTVKALVTDLERDAGCALPVGIGTPGSISLVSGRLRNSNTVCLNGMPLREDLCAALARDVRIANDADCMALSEATDGAATGCQSVFGVILGTGVGGGICVGGNQVAGVNGIAGEWGHITLPLAAYQPSLDEEPRQAAAPRPCFCGRYDCVETHLSGPGLQRSYLERSGIATSSEEIVERARAAEPAAKATLREYCNLLALALSTVINILDPEVIVLAGGLSNIDELYSQVPIVWERYIFSDQVATRLLRSHHGDSSGVRGAAWLWP